MPGAVKSPAHSFPPDPLLFGELLVHADRLLPGFSGEQICCRVGTVRPGGAGGKATLAARGSVSRIHVEPIATVL